LNVEITPKSVFKASHQVNVHFVIYWYAVAGAGVHASIRE
jgi:uncharacterized protein YcfL